jgi:hypothetical protein
MCRTRRPQAPAESQVSKRNARIKRRNFRADFLGYFDVPESESEVFTPEFLVRAHTAGPGSDDPEHDGSTPA